MNSPRWRCFCIFTVCTTLFTLVIYYSAYRTKSVYRQDGVNGGSVIVHYAQYDYPYAAPTNDSAAPSSTGLHGTAAAEAVDREPRPVTVVAKVAAAGGSKPGLVLFSARYDASLNSVVLIGYFNARAGPPPRLQYRLGSGASLLPWQQASQHHVMHEGHGRPYDGIMFFCPCGAGRRPQAYKKIYVTVGTDASAVSLPVQAVAMATGQQQLPNPTGVAACITALRYVPGQETETRFVLRLVEFIEVNRLLGVEHFYFYNWSLPTSASRTLRHYSGLGWATVTQWSLPAGIHPEDDIHYYGQLVVTNDCLYATRDRYRLVTFIDIDEFPVALGGSAGTLTEAAGLHGLQDSGSGTCALGFRHGIFPPLLTNASLSSLPPALAGCHVTNLLYEQRAREVMEFTVRSKLLVVARQVKEMGIHFAWATWTGCKTKALDPATEGLLHHMRQWGAVALVPDATMRRRHGQGIVAAMTDARRRLKQLLGIDICS